MKNRHEVGAAEAGAALVRIVGMEMRGAMGMEPNQLRSGRFIAAHRLDIEMEDKIGMGQTLEQLNCIGARGDKVGFGRR